MPTDTERLDWLTNCGDLGEIRLDYDLEGQPMLEWSVWNEEQGFTSPRAAIDAAMEQHQRQAEALKALPDAFGFAENGTCVSRSELDTAPLKPMSETLETLQEWRKVDAVEPPLNQAPVQSKSATYVLVVDAKARMAVAYFYRYSTGELGMVSGKAIGQPTHWMPLPDPPTEQP